MFISEEEVKFVIHANFEGWHVCGSVVFLRPWGTSSGSFITAMFNTFANWYIHKEAFVNLFEESLWNLVETTFTGDDSVFSTPDFLKAYNMSYLESFFKTYYGMVYTSPTKTSVMTIEWSDLQYLKRTFQIGHFGMMAPLAPGSITNMVKWTDGEQTEQITESVINAVLLEAWHYGPKTYKECYSWANKESKRLNAILRFPDWTAMKDMREKDY
jgi:hypothetical protein